MLTIKNRFVVIQNPVEQQTVGGATQPNKALWITNTLERVWDADDQIGAYWTGSLEPGEEFRTSALMVCDWATHVASFNGQAEKGAILQASMEVTGLPQLYHLAIPSKTSGRYETFKGCILGPWYDNQAPFVLIPGSNGGVGHEVVVTWVLKNTGTRPIRKLTAMVNLAISNFSNCPCQNIELQGVPTQGVYPGPFVKTCV